MSATDMHDDEIRARLGLPALGRPMTMEERIEYNALRAFPEPHDPEADLDLALIDQTRGTALPEGPVAFRRRMAGRADP